MTARDNRSPRLFVPNARSLFLGGEGSSLTLSSDDSHYISHVLRLSSGDLLEVGDPDTGEIALTRLTDTNSLVTVTFQRALTPTAGTPRAPITLLCALCKGQKNDLICDWATELGVAEIVFWQSERSVVRLRDSKDLQNKEVRLRKIAQAAAQQSRQKKPPQVRISPSLKDALESAPGDGTLRLVCSLQPAARPLTSSLFANSALTHIFIAIGPEGDLTPTEESLLMSRGFLPVSLGPQTLRSELATVTAIVSVSHCLHNRE